MQSLYLAWWRIPAYNNVQTIQNYPFEPHTNSQIQSFQIQICHINNVDLRKQKPLQLIKRNGIQQLDSARHCLLTFVVQVCMCMINKHNLEKVIQTILRKTQN